MSVTGKIKSWLGGSSESGGGVPPAGFSAKAFQHLERTHGVAIHKFTDYDSYLDAGSRRIWATWRAVDLVANVVLSTDIKVVDTKGNKKQNDDLQRLLTHPNTHTTFEELLYLTTFHLKLCGNAYWLKDEINPQGQPAALYPLLPQNVEPIADKTSKVSKYKYVVNGEERHFRHDEIIHFKRPHPRKSVLGIGDMEAGEQLFNEFLNQDAFKTNMYKKGAFPAGILVRKEFDGDSSEWERTKEMWEQKYTGQEAAGSIAWLTGDWNFLKLGMTAEEMDSLEQERKTVEQIFIHHGVPLSIAGLEKAANFATARQDYISFRRFTCLPIVRFIFSRLNDPDEFVAAFNPKWTIRHSLSGLVDVEQVYKEYEGLVKDGAMTLNELREKCGLETVNDPLLDQFYIDSNRQPLDSTIIDDEPIEDDIVEEIISQEEVEPVEEEENSEPEEKSRFNFTAKNGHRNSSAFLVASNKAHYDNYPSSATMSSKRALSEPEELEYQLRRVAISLSQGNRVSIKAIERIADASQLSDVRDKPYGEGKAGRIWDACGGTDTIIWACKLLNRKCPKPDTVSAES